MQTNRWTILVLNSKYIHTRMSEKSSRNERNCGTFQKQEVSFTVDSLYPIPLSSQASLCIYHIQLRSEETEDRDLFISVAIVECYYESLQSTPPALLPPDQCKHTRASHFMLAAACSADDTRSVWGFLSLIDRVSLSDCYSFGGDV